LSLGQLAARAQVQETHDRAYSVGDVLYSMRAVAGGQYQ